MTTLRVLEKSINLLFRLLFQESSLAYFRANLSILLSADEKFSNMRRNRKKENIFDKKSLLINLQEL